MKRILFAFAALVFLLPATAQTSKAVDVTVDFFYDNLSGGNWIEVGDYGYCWQPDIAVSDTSWRPYADGYWAYTDLGWTWVSYEDFGWATYHYGRWTRLSDYGWIWVPGREEDLEWGPAWVSWRTGGEYIGWAPLPPETLGVVYRGRPITGHLDVEFNIGPGFYNFVAVRYIGEPVLRERIVPSTQNVVHINQTVNVTNITCKNKVVYNYGPDITVINQHAARPIQRLKIERQENADMSAALKSGALVKPQGDKLVVAAPMHIKKAQNGMAPSKVKTKVEKAKFDNGWSIAGDEKAQAELKEKIKSQDLKKVPPITGGPAAGGSPAPEASASASGHGAASPAENAGSGKRKNENKAERKAESTQNTSAAAKAEDRAQNESKGRHGKKKGGEEPGPTPHQ